MFPEFQSGTGYTFRQDARGITLDILPDDGIDYPFRVFAYKDGETIKVRVRAGTVNNLVPKISSTFLDAETAPTLTISGNNTHRIYLKSSTTSSPVFFPNEVVVESATSDLADTDSNGYLLLATVVIANGSISSVNQYVYASQVLVRVKPGTATAIYSWSSR
jgi:hypothetical protein